MRTFPRLPVVGVLIGLLLALLPTFPHISPPSSAQASELVNGHGYADFKYHSDGKNPTGEKPQSKLWFNDGRWWADMLDPSGEHYIFYLDTASQTWVNTGTKLDPRAKTKSDCLWDGEHLYVVSGGGKVATGENLEAKLYRYSYNSTTRSYSLDSGFPVTVRSGGAETIVIDKDSTGRLWITYTQNKQVWINHSTSSDRNWSLAGAFNPPDANDDTNSASVFNDDISSLVAFDGKIGVLWSKHDTTIPTGDPQAAFYFSYREDTAPLNVAAWQTRKIYSGLNSSDDHISLRSLQVAGKEIYAVVKTSLPGNGTNTPMIVLLGRRADGTWITPTMVSSAADGQTRPVLLVEPEARRLHIFTSSEGGGSIYYKSTSMDAISFEPGKGTPVLSGGSNSGLNTINNATSTKQTVSSATDIVLLASDQAVQWYVHAYIPLGPNGSRTLFAGSQRINSTSAGTLLDPQPTIIVQSKPGVIDTDYNGPVSIAIKAGTGGAGAQLRGTTTVNAVNGVARFTNLAIDTIGSNYRLVASATGYSSSESNAFDITMGSQTITFAPIANQRYGNQPLTLNASASSGLPVSFATSGPCSLNGTLLTLTGVGTCSVTASQPGNHSFAPAPPVQRSFTIAKGLQTITFAPLPNRHYTDTPFTISASASSGLSVSFSASGVCTVSGTSVQVLRAGQCSITATQAGNDLYEAAPPITRTFTAYQFFAVYMPMVQQ